MSREFKFRIWNVVTKSFDYTPNKQYLIGLDGTVYDGNGVIYDELHIIQQYTGLKDKNGKEIYEGDVTRILNEYEDYNTHIVKYGIAQRQMANGYIVDIPGFYFEHTDSGFKSFPIVYNYNQKHDLEMLEVIGNIFENQGLLNGS